MALSAKAKQKKVAKKAAKRKTELAKRAKAMRVAAEHVHHAGCGHDHHHEHDDHEHHEGCGHQH
jgi:hypothetical protein